MKKTIITLMTLAGMAFGAESSYTLSTTPAYDGNQGGRYAGIAFTLGATDTERFTVTGGTLTEQVTLSSISLTERGGNDLAADRVLYVTDSNNVYLGSSSVFTKAEGSDIAVFNFKDSITLNTGSTYYAYLMNSAGDNSWEVGKTVVPGGQYYSGELAAAGGSLTSTAANWGLLNGQKALASTSYAPVMTIVAKSVDPVPEPTTATLSLRALAGRAARRRRR